MRRAPRGALSVLIGIIFYKIFFKFLKFIFQNCFTDIFYKIHHEIEIMDRGQCVGEYFLSVEEVRDVGLGKVLTCVASTPRFDRRKIFAKTRVHNIDLTFFCIQTSIAGNTRRRDAVKEVAAIFDTTENI